MMDGETPRRIICGRAVERVEPARVGKEPERRLRRARVAEEVGERGRFESEGREEGRARDGVERAMEEAEFSGFRLAAASAKEPFGFKWRLVGAEV